MIEQARKNAADEGVKPVFMVSDGQNMNFPDKSFDLIISRNVTWTLFDAEGAYREWKRLLKPEGRVIIFDANWIKVSIKCNKAIEITMVLLHRNQNGMLTIQ